MYMELHFSIVGNSIKNENNSIFNINLPELCIVYLYNHAVIKRGQARSYMGMNRFHWYKSEIKRDVNHYRQWNLGKIKINLKYLYR